MVDVVELVDAELQDHFSVKVGRDRAACAMSRSSRAHALAALPTRRRSTPAAATSYARSPPQRHKP